MLRLGEALLIESGTMPSDFVADILEARPTADDPQTSKESAAAIYSRAVVGRLGEIERAGGDHARDRERLLVRAIDSLKTRLRTSETEPTLALSHRASRTGAWLFQSEKPDWTLTCKPDPAPKTQIGQFEKHDPPPSFAIREKPEELALIGDDREAAGSFALGLERTRTIQDDGSRKTVTDLSIRGTVGLRLSPASSQATTAYVFGRYELQRSRTSPAPVLDPGAKQSDDDTDAVEAGITLQTELLGNDSQVKLFLDGQASAVLDRANDASRLKLRALVRPAIDVSLGICGLGSYEVLDPSASLKARCRVQFDVEGAKILKQGTSPIGDFDTFLAAGGKAEFELLLPAAEGMDILGSVSYRYLSVLHGGPKAIERFEAALKWRFWTSGRVGLDVGFSYLKGRNELSFEREDVLTAGFGVIF
ncbi:MAG TPA: hypothetical protein VHM92_11440 [Allosphingosinicella sp.]|nr:hypothetical protein [Allosphingosinicella sp.]